MVDSWRRRTVLAALAAPVLLPALLALATGCSRKGARGPSREELTSLLQQEAQTIKATGEKLDPVLRVSATWTVTELSVSPRPNDPDRPWAGVIRFRIRAVTKDTGGTTQVDEFDRRFEYQWSDALRRWLIKPAP